MSFLTVVFFGFSALNLTLALLTHAHGGGWLGTIIEPPSALPVLSTVPVSHGAAAGSTENPLST